MIILLNGGNNMTEKYFFTSESVTEGHPDKMCDQISDAILDAMIKDDPNSRAGIECLTKTGFVVVAGEVTTNTYVDIQKIVRETILEIGYDKPEYGFEAATCGVLVAISGQSQDIAMGVNETDNHEQGAGDQGLMFGYATNETPEYMPLPIMLAHKLTQRLASARKRGEVWYLRPDGKSQVTIEYENGKPKRVDTVVISTQHHPDIGLETIRRDMIERIIKPLCSEWIDEQTKYFINPTGLFVIGGPVGDAGCTGRKIIVDTYGGYSRHGGGAFSGKDPTKVDRSGAYAARFLAKNIVAHKLAEKAEVSLAYFIGAKKPLMQEVETFGTAKVSSKTMKDFMDKVERENSIITFSGLILKELEYKLTSEQFKEKSDLLKSTYQKIASMCMPQPANCFRYTHARTPQRKSKLLCQVACRFVGCSPTRQ